MIDIIGINIELFNTVYYFSPNKINLKKGDYVIVDTEQGIQFGKCVSSISKEKEENVVLPLKNVIRKATLDDIDINKKNSIASLKALKEAKKIAQTLNLNMSFVSSSYSFDRKQLFFLYLSEERIDFRELAKKLAQKYKTRIELRQIGIRDKAKLIGGVGPCGLLLCCNSFLTDFNSVSINMAKNQFLALNPTKINGVCGRLFCCLNYENEAYTALKKDMPKIGTTVNTNEGTGKVISTDIFKQKYKVEINKNNIIEMYLGDKDDSIK